MPESRQHVAELDPRLDILAQCLSLHSTKTLPQLRNSLHQVVRLDGKIFEVIAGAPVEQYGARFTFELPEHSKQKLAEHFSYDSHPWGLPDCIGVRINTSGNMQTKAYHMLDCIDDRFVLPPCKPDQLVPVMAAQQQDTTEIYLRKATRGQWGDFVEHCLQPLDVHIDTGRIQPSPSEYGFCVSYKYSKDQLSAITVYADFMTLPKEREIPALWSQGLSEQDRNYYEMCWAAVRSMGKVPGQGHHAMLAWSVEHTGAFHQGVSFRVPELNVVE